VTIFRPSAQVVLWLRVDEGVDTDPLQRQLSEGTCGDVPSATVLTDAASTGVSEDLEIIVDAIKAAKDAPDSVFGLGGIPSRDETLSRLQSQYDEALSNQAAPDRQPQPAAFVGASPDERFVRAGVLPMSVSIDRNGFRTADTATIDISWKDAPFDPRLVRACAVEIVVGVVSAENFAKGVTVFARNADGQLLSVVEQNIGPNGDLAANSTRFVGWVDTWNVKYSDSGDIVSLECRDLTSSYIDTPLVGAIDLNLPLDEGITQFCKCFPGLRGMAIRFGDVNDPDPGTPPVPADAVPRQRKARRGRVTRQARTGDHKMNVWDHITDVCVASGFVPIIRDYELRICRARTLYTNTTPRPRGMLYGRNISSLEFTRKLGGVKVPTIEVRSYDAGIARTRWARWPVGVGQPTAGIFGISDPPKLPQRANEVTPSGANPSERITTYVIKGINDPAKLTSVARDLYEQIGRQELEGNFETSSVSSWDLGRDTENNVADLLSMVSGDPVEIRIASKDPRRPDANPTSVAELQAMSRNARADYLRRLGWSSRVAEQFARLQDAPGFTSVFRAQTVQLVFDHDDGLSVKADFINFVVVGREMGQTSDSSAETAGQNVSASGATTDPNAPQGQLANARRTTQVRRQNLLQARTEGRIQESSYIDQMQECDEEERLYSGNFDDPPPNRSNS